MREWHVTTVAFRWSASDAAGLPTESDRPTTTSVLPG